MVSRIVDLCICYAQKSIYLTAAAYFAPDANTIMALQHAVARGVDVRLLLPGITDSWLALYAGRSHYSVLLEAGVRIHERHDAVLHAKTVVIDGVWSTIGSSRSPARVVRAAVGVSDLTVSGCASPRATGLGKL